VTEERRPEASGRETSGREASPEGAVLDPSTADLLALVEQLSGALDRSDLVELEVEASGTAIVLRKPQALGPAASSAQGVGGSSAVGGDSPLAPQDADAEPAERPSVRAPLTGIFYAAPAPGSAPYVTVGSQVAVGQVIGLIEAMKLFNEIKSDLAGRVARVVADSGSLVKAKQPLIEVDPL
jgi:acetyl-CoA carboxylase biotin carboxyl carrier protein